jgi:uncharacterized membrane protein YoaK (UPF0700 family)
MTSTATSLRFAGLLTVAAGFLDAYTFVTREGVFANAQTANVIFFGVELARRDVHAALSHLWPVLAFIGGIVLAQVVKGKRVGKAIHHPIRMAMAIQILVLVVVGFVPATVSDVAVTVPISFVAAMQLGLFRRVRSLNYITIATTGNMMRLTEAGFAALVRRDRDGRAAVGIYSAIVASFAVGALVGAGLSRAVGTSAAWAPAGLLLAALVLFYVDDRRAGRAVVPTGGPATSDVAGGPPGGQQAVKGLQPPGDHQ